MTPVSDITPRRLLIRCLLEHKGDQWQAFSLEFGLAVQGESAIQVRGKLEDQIRSYLNDALVGPDREHADVLLSRTATWRVYAKYHFFGACAWLSRVWPLHRRHHDGMTFVEPMPLRV
jgi:hypothetical protein